MRLIDADELRNDWLINGENAPVYETNDFLYAIDSTPTIDAAPVVHGRWIKRNDGPYGQNRLYCSACGEHGALHKERPYCPNCGARMDAGEAEK